LSAIENVLVGRHVRMRADALRRLWPLGVPDRADRDRARALLERVGLAGRAEALAGELSYGDQRRLEIARALASEPRLLLLDEPAAGMNPAETGRLRDLIRALVDEGLAILLIEHDVRLVMGTCERIAVLYAGRIVESGATADLLAHPRHPYTLGLLRSLPPSLGSGRRLPLQPIPGSPPSPWDRPEGCRFVNRCPRAREDCARGEPQLLEMDGRQVACFHPLEEEAR